MKILKFHDTVEDKSDETMIIEIAGNYRIREK